MASSGTEGGDDNEENALMEFVNGLNPPIRRNLSFPDIAKAIDYVCTTLKFDHLIIVNLVTSV